MLTLELYTTDHCTLCEQAMDLLFGMPELAGHELRVVDIATSNALIERYGELIPVLRWQSRELYAPFGRDEILQWLNGLVDAAGR